MSKSKLTSSKINLIRETDVSLIDGKWQVKNRLQVVQAPDGSTKEIDPFVRGISESRLFRIYGTENFFIFSCNRKSNRDKVLQLLTKGIEYNGKLWFPVINSASELRSQKGLWTCLDRDQVIKQITFGAEFAKNGKVCIPKKVSYTGLASSTTKEIDLQFSYRHIEDVRKKIVIEVELFNSETGQFDPVTMEVETTPSDGGGYISFGMAVKIARQLGLRYIPSAFQVRFGGEKGLLLVWKWNKSLMKVDPVTGITRDLDCDILFSESMHKFTIGADYDHNAPHELDAHGNITKYNPRLEICGWTKPRTSKHAFLCYQFVQAMNIPFEDLKQMTDDAIQKVHNVLNDIVSAKIFLGMFSSASEDVEQDEENENLVNKISKVIHADENMLFDPWVQNKLKSLLEKYVLDMRKGRVPVEGSYQYIFSDPQEFFGDAMLQSGQSFYNNVDGEGIVLRAPIIHTGEVSMLLFYTTDEINAPEFLSKVYKVKGFDDFAFGWDIIFLNNQDDVLLRAGGADIDGDRMFLTFMEKFRKIYNYTPFSMSSLKVKPLISKDDNDAYIKFILDSYCSTSKIGEYVNYSTVWKDIPYNLPQYTAQADYSVRRLSIDVVYEIDSVKTGFKPEVPDAIKLPHYPHWMEMNVGRSADAKVKEYHSLSPLGKNFDYVLQKWSEIRQSVLTNNASFKKSLQLMPLADTTTYNHILPVIQRYEKAYRTDMATINRLETAGKISTEIAKERRIQICEDYRELVESIDADVITVAVATYITTYATREGGNSSYSFPWITAFDGLLFAIAQTSESRNKLYKVRFYSADVIAYHGMEVTFIKGHDQINECRTAKIVPDGTYKLIENDGNFYITFENSDVLVPKLEVTVPTVSSIAFQIRGFNHQGFNAKQVIDLLTANNGVCYCRAGDEYILVYTQNDGALIPIATVAKEDDYTVLKVSNMQLQVTNLDGLSPTYWSKRTGNLQFTNNLSLICKVISPVDFADQSQSDEFKSQLLNLGIEITSVDFDQYNMTFNYDGKSYSLSFISTEDGYSVLNVKSEQIKSLIESYLNNI